MANCTVYVSDGGLCTPAFTQITVGDLAQCSWSIIGGRAQAHYTVGLTLDAGSGGATAAVDACSPFFHVESAKDSPPSYDTIMLRHFNVNTPEGVLIRAQLAPMSVATCPQVGLECPIALP